MLSVIKSGGFLGVEGYQVDVEVSISKGLPQFVLVGLPDKAVNIIKEWVAENQESLLHNWEKAVGLEPLEHIKGADND